MENFEVNKTSRRDEFEEALERVKRDFFSNKCKSDKPLFILAGGQPGCGKTAMIDTIKADNRGREFITIDLDEFRAYHPDFETIKKYHKKDGVLLTNSFAFQIEDEMIKYALENSLNTINLATLRNTDLVLQNIQGLSLAGFMTKVYVLAVSPEESYLSTLIRFKEQETDPNCITRFTSKGFHDEAFKGMNNTIRKLQHSNIPITVCKRAGKKDEPAIIVFDTKSVNKGESADETINAIRADSRRRAERTLENLDFSFVADEEYVQEDFKKLISQMDDREL